MPFITRLLGHLLPHSPHLAVLDCSRQAVEDPLIDIIDRRILQILADEVSQPGCSAFELRLPGR